MRLPAGVQSAARAVLDVLFPIACVGCGTYREDRTPETEDGTDDEAERWLCTSCRSRIAPDRARCIVCGAPSPAGRTCYPCLRRTPIVGTLAVGPYRDPILRAALTTLKFRGIRALAHPLGELLARHITAVGFHQGPLPHLVALPLHPRRERTRGFNQAQLLAEVVGTRLGLPVAHLLVRTRSTASQTSLLGSAAVRRQNVADAFALREDAPQPVPPRLILVDDVLTSGATLETAAAVLNAAGAQELWVAVVARG